MISVAPRCGIRRSSMRAERSLAAALGFLVFVAAGCASRPTVPLGDQPPSAGPYRIKVGDYLGVRFYKTPELNVEVPVRSDGKISLEVLGDVQAAGFEPTELSRLLSERYEAELTNPRVTVIVLAFGGQVFVGGEVKYPSAVAFATGMSVLQAI